jgi:predicted amidohydrolase
MPMGGWEQRILNFERLVNRLQDELRRLAARLRAAEEQLYQAWGSGGGGGGSGEITQAILTTNLATGTLASPAGAMADIYNFNGSAWIIGPNEEVLNSYAMAASITSGKQITIYKKNGKWHIVQREC